MKMIRQPSDREVIWICGELVSKLPRNLFRIFSRCSHRFEEQNSKYSVLLSKRPLQTADIFLFNDTRAGGGTYQNYAVLEHIKDGCATSSKYGSNVIRFKTPNIVVVFSNNTPSTSYLSADRWSVHKIDSDRLRCIK